MCADTAARVPPGPSSATQSPGDTTSLTGSTAAPAPSALQLKRALRGKSFGAQADMLAPEETSPTFPALQKKETRPAGPTAPRESADAGTANSGAAGAAAGTLELAGAQASLVSLDADFARFEIGQLGNEAIVAKLTDFATMASGIRSRATALVDGSSVARADRAADPKLPSASEVQAWNQAIARLRAWNKDPAVAAAPEVEAALEAATREAADAALALFQARAALSARASWRTKATEPSPADLRAGNIDPEFQALNDDAKHTGNPDKPARAAHVGIGLDHPGEAGKEEAKAWCGFFVSANLVRAAGLEGIHDIKLWHASDAPGFFSYHTAATKGSNATARYVWSEEQHTWMPLEAYHALRGSLRMLWARQKDAQGRATSYAGKFPDIAEAFAAGGARAGDVVVRDPMGERGHGHHYGLIEAGADARGQLTTLEGNYQGVRPDGSGAATRDRGGNLKMGEFPKFRDEQTGKSRSRDGIGLVVHDPALPSRKGEQQGVHESAQNIAIIGRPSVCDFESHHYLDKAPPDPRLSPQEMQDSRKAKR